MPTGKVKTTILEAACVLLRLQSQRASSLGPVVQLGREYFRVRGTYGTHELEFRYGGLRRCILFDGVEQRTASEYLRFGRVVSFANADIELVRGGSEARRRYLDFLGTQIDATYRPSLRAYERALRARNALLKTPSARARERAAYDLPLVEHGTRLRQARQSLVQRLIPHAERSYRQISGNRERFALEFVSGAAEDFAADLELTRAEETRLRQTLVGPHRDDIALRVQGEAAAQFASEGQHRTIALAMKLAQVEIFRSEGVPPLLLLDDIFGELDVTRRNALLDHLPADAQKLVTATAMQWRCALEEGATYELRERQLIRK